MRAADLPDNLPGVASVDRSGEADLLTLDGIGPQDLLAMLLERNVEVESFEQASVPLNEIFVAVVQGRDSEA